MPAQGEPSLGDGVIEQAALGARRGELAPQQGAGQLGVGAPGPSGEPLALSVARPLHALGDHGGGLGVGASAAVDVHRSHTDAHVHPVQHRPGQPRQVPAALQGRARAAVALAVGLSARAGVGGEDQLEAGRIAGDAAGAVQRDVAGLERFAQRLEHAGGELRGLVEEEHSGMGAGDRAGPGEARAAADDRRGGGGVVRVLEGRGAQQTRVGVEAFGEGVDGGDGQGVLDLQGREDARDARGDHRLACSGRPGQQQMVASGGGDLGGAAGLRLPHHVGEVRARVPTGEARGRARRLRQRRVPGR